RSETVLHEAAPQAGGRCRSYFDSTLNMTIDNGNHLLLSGNFAALSFAKKIGGDKKLGGPQEASFDFCDLARKRRWKLRPNAGRFPWWVLSPDRRAPNTAGMDYLSLVMLLFAKPNQTLRPFLGSGEAARNLWDPLFISALNADPAEASATLAGAIVRETFAQGGAACRPLVAVDGLSAAFVDPALDFLRAHGAEIRFGAKLRAIRFADGRAATLDFGEETVTLAPDDKIVLAVTAPVAAALLPGLKAPDEFRAIVNAHFAYPAPQGLPLLTGVIGGATEWLFGFSDRLSVTISAAERFLATPREDLAATIWAEVQAVAGFSGPLPAWQIIKEKRATFAATPQQDALRPGTATPWRNLVLAGDWTQTGLPATIEGAVRSGLNAARLCAIPPVTL
ncbi:MAG TPA: hydroxysqualene dehydroxylase HpnE, partial [Rhodoblastus sp.]|nr:hydroxysqualene dehydroxylase HpnE [Rhodoblastus sp.]